MKQALPECDVLSLSHDGRAVCRLDDKVLFVRGALPGQRVVVRVEQDKKRFAEGVAVRVTRQASDLVPPACPHAALCGGCALQQLPYARQLYWKQHFVAEALQRITRVDVTPEPVVPSPLQWQYRNKMTLAFAQDGSELRVGLRAAASHEVFPVERCPLMPDAMLDVARAVRELAQEQLDAVPQGFWRFVVLRMPSAGGEGVRTCLTHCITGPASARAQAVVRRIGERLMHEMPLVTGFVHDERRRDDTLAQGERTCTRLGQYVLHERLGGVAFTLGHDSFFQVNHGAAEALCRCAGEVLAPQAGEVLWDLYCGVGAPGLCLIGERAGEGVRLFGVEYAAEAVRMARANAEKCGVTAQYVAGDAKRAVTQFPEPHKVLVDPPRAGLHEDVTRTLLAARPAEIVYISCNPGTLGRDIARLRGGYDVARVTPVDMFPQTPHVETVVLLRRREN